MDEEKGEKMHEEIEKSSYSFTLQVLARRELYTC
jgi:hypothetical protein